MILGPPIGELARCNLLSIICNTMALDQTGAMDSTKIGGNLIEEGSERGVHGFLNYAPSAFEKSELKQLRHHVHGMNIAQFLKQSCDQKLSLTLQLLQWGEVCPGS